MSGMGMLLDTHIASPTAWQLSAAMRSSPESCYCQLEGSQHREASALHQTASQHSHPRQQQTRPQPTWDETANHWLRRNSPVIHFYSLWSQVQFLIKSSSSRTLQTILECISIYIINLKKCMLVHWPAVFWLGLTTAADTEKIFRCEYSR